MTRLGSDDCDTESQVAAHRVETSLEDPGERWREIGSGRVDEAHQKRDAGRHGGTGPSEQDDRSRVAFCVNV